MKRPRPPRRFRLHGELFTALLALAATAVAVFLHPTSRPGSPLPSPRMEPPAGACPSAYEEIFARSPLRVRVIFGYKDTRPARFVADRYERAIFAQRILAPCAGNRADCGFSRDESDADLFQKTVAGPDGRPRLAELRLAQSSIGPDDETNRADPFQRWQSAHARAEFVDGLRAAEIVFYNGHSRAGGGPDFEPPRITPTKEPQYGWYRSQQPGLKLMIGALTKDSRTRVVGLFSCASDRLFAIALRTQKTGLGVIASDRLIYFADALESSLAALSGLLKMECQPELERDLTARSAQAGTKIIGFFRE